MVILVGRAEFSGQHLLELRGLRPVNTFGLLESTLVEQAANGIYEDRQTLFARSPGASQFALLEHEMQGQYMRGLIAHVMNIINQYCTVYQAFTHPAVYGFMWAIHPAHRLNQTYVEALKQLHPRLLETPWARTNRALSGVTVGAYRDLRPRFHDYPGWVCGELFESLLSHVRPDWFESTGLFSGCQVERFLQDIVKPYTAQHHSSTLLWLASFRQFVERLETLEKQVKLDPADIQEGTVSKALVQGTSAKLLQTSKTLLKQKVPSLHFHMKSHMKWGKRALLRYQALRQFPPQKGYPLDREI